MPSFPYKLLFFLLSLAVPPVVQADVITLQNGDILSGEIINENHETITLEHSVLGVVNIPKNQIAPTAKATQEPPPVQQKLSGVFGTNFLEEWQRRFALGVKGEEGNDVSMDINVALDASHHDEVNRQVFSSAYYYETDHREKDKSKGHANFVRDWLMPQSRWFYYSFTRYEYDSFKWWKHRLSFSGGSGYDFYKENNFELRGRVGLGFNKTWGTDNEFDPEGLLGVEFSWKPDAVHHISSQFIFYPNFGDFGEFRTWFQSTWEISLDFFPGLGLEFGLEHEFDSVINEKSKDDRHYDLIYFGRVGLDF